MRVRDSARASHKYPTLHPQANRLNFSYTLRLSSPNQCFIIDCVYIIYLIWAWTENRPQSKTECTERERWKNYIYITFCLAYTRLMHTAAIKCNVCNLRMFESQKRNRIRWRSFFFFFFTSPLSIHSANYSVKLFFLCVILLNLSFIRVCSSFEFFLCVCVCVTKTVMTTSSFRAAFYLNAIYV